MKQCILPVALLVALLVVGGCLFGGPASPTLEIQNPPASGPIDVQLLDSSVEPGEVYLKLVVHNANAQPLLIDRRCFVLTDGRAERLPVFTSKPFVTVKPNATSSKIKLTYEGLPADTLSYDLAFKKGAFHLDNEAGKEVAMPTLRLLVKKAAVTTPEAPKAVAPGAVQPR